jgi:hypothetical protein
LNIIIKRRRLTAMKKITLNLVDSNHHQLQKIQEVVATSGNHITTTDIINIALREFFNNATTVNTDMTPEENIAEVLKCYLRI